MNLNELRNNINLLYMQSNISIHQVALLIPLTGEVNNIDYTVEPVRE